MLEMLIAVLVFVMASCFFGEMSYVKAQPSDVLKGMFVPKLKGQRATGDAIALLGALVMPHNLFLHSALVLSREVPSSVRGINVTKYFLMESGLALFVAFLVNVAVVSVSSTVCSANNLSNDNSDRCNDLTLNSASFLLQGALLLPHYNTEATTMAIIVEGEGQAEIGCLLLSGHSHHEREMGSRSEQEQEEGSGQIQRLVVQLSEGFLNVPPDHPVALWANQNLHIFFCSLSMLRTTRGASLQRQVINHLDGTTKDLIFSGPIKEVKRLYSNQKESYIVSTKNEGQQSEVKEQGSNRLPSVLALS